MYVVYVQQVHTLHLSGIATRGNHIVVFFHTRPKVLYLRTYVPTVGWSAPIVLHSHQFLSGPICVAVFLLQSTVHTVYVKGGTRVVPTVHLYQYTLYAIILY